MFHVSLPEKAGIRHLLHAMFSFKVNLGVITDLDIVEKIDNIIEQKAFLTGSKGVNETIKSEIDAAANHELRFNLNEDDTEGSVGGSIKNRRKETVASFEAVCKLVDGKLEISRVVFIDAAERVVLCGNIGESSFGIAISPDSMSPVFWNMLKNHFEHANSSTCLSASAQKLYNMICRTIDDIMT